MENAHEGREDSAGMSQRPIEQAQVTVSKLLKERVEQVVGAPNQSLSACRRAIGSVPICANLGLEKIRHHGGDERAGQQVRRQHGENHCHGERRKQISAPFR